MKKVSLLIVVLLFPILTHSQEAERFELANHLLHRVTFGATFEETQQFAELSYEKAVERLVDFKYTYPVKTVPAWVSQPYERGYKKMSQDEKRALQKKLRKQGRSLKKWWFDEMINTQNPVQEWMTLFWHGHLTSGVQKVRSPLLMYQQNSLLRKNALGSFRDMLHAIAQDPAMLIYLDNRNNKKKHANENFARELLELFTLGEGNYTENDIKVAAKAFTGWGLNTDAGTYKFKSMLHDFGEKSFMGQRGRLNGDDIINILLDNPKTAQHLTHKLWRALVSNEIRPSDNAEITEIANQFYASDYQIEPWLKSVLLSKAFRDPKNRGTLFKSPVDLIVGLYRQLPFSQKSIKNIAAISKRLGQDVFNPPNVKGWPGGESWITSGTLMLRHSFLSRVSRGKEMTENSNIMMSGSTMQKMKPPAITGKQLYRWVLPAKNIAKSKHGMLVQDWFSTMNPILLDPAYQLK